MTRNRLGTARISVCMAGLLAFASSSYGSSEAKVVDQFEVKILANTLGGREIIAGEYIAAIEQIQSTPSLDSRYVRNTNLCAAYIARGEFTLAEAQCKAALRASRSASTGLQNTNRARMASKNDQATALNNLGVLNALQGNNEEALKYFQSASNRSKSLRATTNQNISVLEQRTGSAVVASS